MAANYNGGAIFCENGCTAVMRGTTFNNVRANGASSTAGGALFFSQNCVVDLDDCTFTNCYVNYANDNAKGGGAIYFGTSCTATFDNCKFNNNYISHGNNANYVYGGAIYFSDDCDVSFNKTVFDSNKLTSTYRYAVLYGGAIYFSGNINNAKFIECDFINNGLSNTNTQTNGNPNKQLMGGAIYVSGTSTGMNIIKCTFNKNYVSGHLTYIASAAADIYIQGDVTNLNMSDSTFTSSSNTASSNGASILFNGILTNSNIGGDFTGYKTNANGGVIYVSGMVNGLNIHDSTFTSNTANIYGGAICFNDVTGNINITKSTFTGNTAQYGGAVDFWNGAANNVNIKGSTFTQNTATGGSGGAILVYSGANNFNITDSTFTSNVGSTIGPAVSFYRADQAVSGVNIIGSKFTGHTTGTGTVYFARNPGTLNVIGSSFTDNTATTNNGAAIYFPSLTTGNFINSSFTRNTAPSGGALYFHILSDCEYNFNGCNFSENKASSKFAGAVYIYKHESAKEDISFVNCKFDKNIGKGSKDDDIGGGAITFNMGNSNHGINPQFINCTFNSNEGYSGGAISLKFVESFTIDGCSFDKNTAGTNYGGAIFYDKSYTNIIITNSNFTNNHANDKGGAIRSSYSYANIYIDNCIFENDTADGNGGALSIPEPMENKDSTVKDNINFTCTNSKFTNNNAPTYGAVLVIAYNVLLDGNSFVQNSATGGIAGALELKNLYGLKKFDNCIFEDNSADGYQGGAVHMNSSKIKTFISDNLTFTGNTAKEGAGIYFVQALDSLEFTNSKWINNTASDNGAGIYVQSGTNNIKLDKCEFTGNTAVKGSTIYMAGTTAGFTVTNSNFTDNEVTGDNGGALTITSSCSDVTIDNNNFISNKASNDGGAIYLVSTYTADITNCKFTANNAPRYGGAVMYGTSNGNIDKCIFNDNVAQYWNNSY